MTFEEFAQRTLLLDEGKFVATYKFAVVLGLIDTLVESVGTDGRAPETVGTRELAGKVIAIYWPQTTPVAGPLTLPRDHGINGRLQQNHRGQAEIVSRIVRFREQTTHDPTGPLSQARLANPAAFAKLERFVEWKLVEMPLGRLQLIGKSYEPFIYTLGWSTRITQSVVQSDHFDGQLQLLPYAAEDHLERLLLRMTHAGSAGALEKLATQAGWESHPAVTLAIARSTT